MDLNAVASSLRANGFDAFVFESVTQACRP